MSQMESEENRAKTKMRATCNLSLGHTSYQMYCSIIYLFETVGEVITGCVLILRITAKRLRLTRPSVRVGRYKMLKLFHYRTAKADPIRYVYIINSF